MEHVNDPQEGLSMERAFEAEPIPSFSETITPRSLAVSFILGATLSVVAMKISLNSGFLPSLSIPAGLLAFYLSRAGIRVLDCFKVSHLPFTRQENTVIHTCVVACSSITYSGGFGTFILAMGKKAAGADDRDVKNIVEPSIGRLIAFLFLVSFAGLFILMPLRKFMIIRHRLTFPSGTATAHLINSFHTPQGAKQARQQVKMLFSSFGGTVMWSIFQWFFTAGRGCGFKTFPMFGLQAVKHGFYFDFSMSNVGIGMICPYMITVSMFVGTILSSGFVWLYLSTKEGVWFPARMSSNSLSGIRGYKVFIGISMILADGLFNLLSIMVCTLCTMYKRRKQLVHGGGGGGNAQLPFQCLDAAEQQQPVKSFDDRRRAQVFLRDQIPDSVTIGCYVFLSVVSTVGIPYLYPQLKYHHVALIYLAAPAFAFCDAYGFGVTDMNLSTTYGKLAMLIFGSWVGLNDGGVIAALVACGIVMGIMCNSNDLMQDLKTGYLTLTSPRIVFISQVIGTALGCVISPVVFWVFYNVYRTSGGGMDVYIPYPKVYRGIAMLGVGENGLPRHIMHLCKFFFALALALSAFRELAERRRWRVRSYVPSTVGIAVAFFVPPRLPIDMFIGGLGLYLWERIEATQARTYSSAVASGLICGDGLGSLLSSLMTLTAARAPICITFLSRPDNVRLDAFLGTLPMS